MSRIDDILADLKSVKAPSEIIKPKQSRIDTLLEENTTDTRAPTFMDTLTVAGREAAAAIPLQLALVKQALTPKESGDTLESVQQEQAQSDLAAHGITFPNMPPAALSKLEADVTNKKRAEVNRANIQRGFEYYRAKVADWIPPEERKLVQAEVGKNLTDLSFKELVPNIVHKTLYNLPQMMTAAAPSTVGMITGNLVGAAAGAVATTPIVAAQEAANQYQQYYEFLKELGVDDKLSQEIGAKYAIGYGIASGATENLGSLAESINFVKALTSKPGWGTLARIALNAFGEGAEEGTQQAEANKVLRMMADEVKTLTGKYDQKLVDKYTGSIGQSALTGAAVGGMTFGVPAALKSVGETGTEAMAKHINRKIIEFEKHQDMADAEVRAAYDAYDRMQDKITLYQSNLGDDWRNQLSEEQADELRILENAVKDLPQPTPAADKFKEATYQALLRTMPDKPSEAMLQAQYITHVAQIMHRATGQNPEAIFEKLTVESNKQPPADSLFQSFDRFYKLLTDYKYKKLKGLTPNADKYAGTWADGITMQLGRAKTKAEVDKILSEITDAPELVSQVAAGWKEPTVEQLKLFQEGNRLPYYSSLGEAFSSGAMKLPLDTKTEGKQILGRIQNFQGISKDEIEYFKEQGLEKFLSEPRTGQEVAAWLQSRKPQVAVKLLYAEGSHAKQASEDFYNLQHKLETYGYQVDNGMVHSVGNFLTVDRTNLPKELNDLIDETIAKEELAFTRGDDSTESATARYTMVNPKALKDMPGAVDILVRLPLEEVGRTPSGAVMNRTEDVKYQSNHYPLEGINLLVHVRGYMEGDTFFVFEVQSDWAQAVREQKEQIQSRAEAGMTTAGERDMSDPILAHYERLAIKAAIDHAREIGAKYIAISDAETAMLTEGHDRASSTLLTQGTYEIPAIKGVKVTLSESNLSTSGAYELTGKVKVPEDISSFGYTIVELKNIETGKLGLAQLDTLDSTDANFLSVRHHMKENLPSYISIEQEPGMRLHYDKTLPKIAEELTGQRGQVVSFGEHKNTKAPNTSGGSELLTRKDLIFKNPDGTPKTSITARSYDISGLPAESFSAFGKDKASNRERGIYYQGEHGAITYFRDSGKAVIYALENANFSTFMHELMHYYELSGMFTKAEIKVFEDWLKTKQDAWGKHEHERIANAFEKYLHDNIAPTKGLSSIFARMATWMRSIYTQIAGGRLDIAISPEIRAVFDKMFVKAHKQGVYGKLLTPSRRYQVRNYKGRPHIVIKMENAQGVRKDVHIDVSNILRGEAPYDTQKAVLGDMLKYVPPTDEEVTKALEAKAKAKKITQPKPTATQLRNPFIGHPIEASLSAKLAWAWAASGTSAVKDLLHAWHMPFSRKVRSQGATGYKLNTMSNHVIDRFNRMWGDIYDLLSESLKLTGGRITSPKQLSEQVKYRKANRELNEQIINVKGTSANRLIELALLRDGELDTLIAAGILDASVKTKLDNLSDEARDIIEHVRELNRYTGKLAENVVQPDGTVGLVTKLHEKPADRAKREAAGEPAPTERFKHEASGNVVVRMLNGAGYYLGSQPENSMEFLSLVQAIRDANPDGEKITLDQIRGALYPSKERKSSMEVARSIKYMPSSVIIKTPEGSRMVDILNTRTYDYMLSLVQRTLLRISYVSVFGQNSNETDKMLDKFVAEGGNIKDADNLIKALNGIPVYREEHFMPGTAAWAIRELFGFIPTIYRMAWLSGMVVSNLIEPFGLTMMYGGPKRYFAAELANAWGNITNLLGHPDTKNKLDRVSRVYGAINQMPSNWLMNRGNLMRDLHRIVPALSMHATGGSWVTKRNEYISAVTAYFVTEDMKDGNATEWDRFVLKLFEFTPEEVEAMMHNEPSYLGINDPQAARTELDKLYQDYVTRSVERSQGTTSQPAQISAAGSSQGWKTFMWFDKYGRKQWDRLARMFEVAAENNDPNMYKAATQKAVGFILYRSIANTLRIGVTAATNMYLLYVIRSLISGKGFGDDEIKNEPVKAVEKMAAGFMLSGYMDAFFRNILGDKKISLGEHLVDTIPNLSAWSDFKDFLSESGAYTDYPDWGDRTEAWFKRNVIAARYMSNIAAMMHFNNLDIKTRNARSRAYNYSNDKQAELNSQRFHGYMKQASQAIMSDNYAEANALIQRAYNVDPQKYDGKDISASLKGMRSPIPDKLSTQDKMRLMKYNQQLEYIANSYNR